MWQNPSCPAFSVYAGVGQLRVQEVSYKRPDDYQAAQQEDFIQCGVEYGADYICSYEELQAKEQIGAEPMS